MGGGEGEGEGRSGPPPSLILQKCVHRKAIMFHVGEGSIDKSHSFYIKKPL